MMIEKHTMGIRSKAAPVMMALIFAVAALAAIAPTVAAEDGVGENIDVTITDENVDTAVQSAIYEAAAAGGGTVTVISDGVVTIDTTIVLSIPEGVRVIWNARISATAFLNVISLDDSTEGKASQGIFELGSTGSIEVTNTSDIGNDCALWAAYTEVVISGGTMICKDSAFSYPCAIYSLTDVTMTGGKIEMTATAAGSEACAIYSSGNVKVTGGTVAATGAADSLSICLFGGGNVAAYLKGTCTADVWVDEGNSGMIVEADTLSVPASRGGSDKGLEIVASSFEDDSVSWDTTGAYPLISFKMRDNGGEETSLTMEWGEYGSDGIEMAIVLAVAAIVVILALLFVFVIRPRMVKTA